jgi:hypothetical protein
MEEMCAICRRPLRAEDAVAIRAGRHELGRVHEVPCSETVRSAVRAGGLFALYGARRALKAKFPNVAAFLEGFARVRRQTEPRHDRQEP